MTKILRGKRQTHNSERTRSLIIVAALLLLTSIAFCSCGVDQVEVSAPPAVAGRDGVTGVDGLNGQDGTNGTDGQNGHSLVSQYLPTSSLECSTNGGSRLDVYLDLDDSLSVSEGDIFQNSLVACNGSNGLFGLDGDNGGQGEQGPQGLAGNIGPQGVAGADGLPGPTGAQGPQGIPGLPGEDSFSASIVAYTSGSCTNIVGSNRFTKPTGNNSGIYMNGNCTSSSKEFELGVGDSFWVYSDMLAVKLGTTGIRVITFN